MTMHLDSSAVIEMSRQKFQMEELNAPIANMDLEDWLDLITTTTDDEKSKSIDEKFATSDANLHDRTKINKQSSSRTRLNSSSSGSLIDSIDLCNSLEDLVKTFDKNVKECLRNYKNIDIGQLAPVQLRTQEDLINDSQMWYTLTGNFGNLLPIDYWSKSLVRKYHNKSLDLKLTNKHSAHKKQRSLKLFKNTNSNGKNFPFNKKPTGFDEFSFKKQPANHASIKSDRNNNYTNDGRQRVDSNATKKTQVLNMNTSAKNLTSSVNSNSRKHIADFNYKYSSDLNLNLNLSLNGCGVKNTSESCNELDDNYFYDDESQSMFHLSNDRLHDFVHKSSTFDFDDEDDEDEDDLLYDTDYDDLDDDTERDSNDVSRLNDSLDFDEIDDEELKEQLDMHSMILSKSCYNDAEFDDPIITAEQVLSEIDNIMNMQEQEECCCDERTPDSGCYSVAGLQSSSSIADFSIDSNGLSYLKYINTFAAHQQDDAQADKLNHTNDHTNDERDQDEQHCSTANDLQSLVFSSSREQLHKLNLFELNEIIDQIESTTKELSDTLVQELALRDELEFEKETKNTFISLLMSIQEKRRQLSIDNYHNRHINSVNQKKKNRKSLSNFNFDSSTFTHLTTIIPYNSEIKYSVQHLQILNKLLKAINDDSHQVPELLTNYILKVVCPT